MAIKATIFKASLHIADMDRHYYNQHSCTLARHPSENERRLMARLAVFALNAEPGLNFTRGISTDDEPDLWHKADNGDINLWIELGQPDEKRLRQACGRARKVNIYCHNGRASQVWWEQIGSNAQRHKNLSVIQLESGGLDQLAEMSDRNMTLHCSVQDGELQISDGQNSVVIGQTHWQ